MRQTAIPSLLSASALVIALLALLGERTTPAGASSLVAQIGPAALGSGFTYQGSLTRAGQPISGVAACDLRFSLWDAAASGTPIGSAQTINGVDFVQGLFTVTVNDAGQFGPTAFDGNARWVQVEATCPPGSSATTLGRQAITVVPYASHSGSTGALQGRPLSSAAPTTGQVLAWDGNAWSPAADATGVRYQRTVLVSPQATPNESGTVLIQSLQAINDASADKPYLLKIEPGIYDLGFGTLQLKPYVDVEGSGQGVTLLRGERQTDDVTGLVNATSNAELRQLSIEVTSGSGTFAVGISNNNASPRISDVTIRTDGATSYGIVNRSGASPWIERVTVNATGATMFAAGIAHFDGGTPTIVDSSLRGETTGTGGAAGLYVVGAPAITVQGGRLEGAGAGANFNERSVTTIRTSGAATVRVYDSRLKAGNLGIRLDAGTTALIAGSELDFPSTLFLGTGGNTLKCIGSYFLDLTPLNSLCVP